MHPSTHTPMSGPGSMPCVILCKPMCFAAITPSLLACSDKFRSFLFASPSALSLCPQVTGEGAVWLRLEAGMAALGQGRLEAAGQLLAAAG